MVSTFVAPMGDRGRLVVPAELRARQHWKQGVPLLMIETARGVILVTREQGKALVRSQLQGKEAWSRFSQNVAVQRPLRMTLRDRRRRVGAARVLAGRTRR